MTTSRRMRPTKEVLFDASPGAAGKGKGNDKRKDEVGENHQPIDWRQNHRGKPQQEGRNFKYKTQPIDSNRKPSSPLPMS
jgi:hypothetical protein